MLLSTSVAAIVSKSVSVSLITLFYSSLMVGIIFTVYGSTVLGLFEIITFAGVVSVMLLTTVLMTSESRLDMGENRHLLALMGIVLAAVLTGFALIIMKNPLGASSGASASELLQFIWQFRPWDMLILLVIFSSAMVVVVNLFSKEAH